MMKTFTMLGTLLLVLTLASPVLAGTRHVNCDKKNQTITKVLARARPGDTIRISGTCRERVIITTDRLTLEGRDNAKLDGKNVDLGGASGLLTIDGAQGIVITGELTVQNSAAIGMVVVNNAQAFFHGKFDCLDNASHGLLAFSGGSMRFNAGDVKAENNRGDGLVVANGANAFVAFVPDDAFTLTSVGNRHGIQLANGGSLQVLGGTLTASGNNGHGLRAAYGANLFMSGFARVFLQDNNLQGLNIESNAQAFVSNSPAIMEPTVTITGNTEAGVSVQAGFIDLHWATITGNSTGPMGHGDVDLGFGTRANLTDNTIDILRCDETVLLSPDSDVACPAP